MFQRNLRGHARASYNGVSGRFLSFSLPGPQRITLVSCRSFSSTTYLKNEAMPLPSKDKVFLFREIAMMILRTISNICIFKDAYDDTAEHVKQLYLQTQQVYSEKITRIVDDISSLNLLEVNTNSPLNGI